MEKNQARYFFIVVKLIHGPTWANISNTTARMFFFPLPAWSRLTLLRWLGTRSNLVPLGLRCTASAILRKERDKPVKKIEPLNLDAHALPRRERSSVWFNFAHLRFYLAFLRPSHRVAFPPLNRCLWPSRPRGDTYRRPPRPPRRRTLGRGYSALQQELWRDSDRTGGRRSSQPPQATDSAA